MRRLSLGALAVLLLVLAGCQRLNFEKEATLDADPLMYEIDGPSSEMKISVKVEAEKPVNVWVVLEDDKESASNEVSGGNKPAKSLAGQEDTKDAEFEATIPAKKNFIVFVGQAKKTRGSAKVKVNVKSK
jgi:hypothetical protein